MYSGIRKIPIGLRKAQRTHGWRPSCRNPTNNLIAGERHIRTAIGRDYADVPPTKGIFKGKPESELTVSVRVAPSDAPPPPEEVLALPAEWQAAVAAEEAEQLLQQQQQQQQ
jgi:hypothetical protein